MRYILTILLMTGWAITAEARSVSDVQLAETVQIEEGGPTLSLNGAALRQTFMIIDTYVGGLYLENPTHDENEIIHSEESKRMLFHVMLKKVNARKIGRALKDALVVSTTEEEAARMEPAINKFLAMFDGQLKRGDEVSIDYLPGKGTRVTIAGEDKGTISDREFSRALLGIWVGEDPVSGPFKRQILGFAD